MLTSLSQTQRKEEVNMHFSLNQPKVLIGQITWSRAEAILAAGTSAAAQQAQCGVESP